MTLSFFLSFFLSLFIYLFILICLSFFLSFFFLSSFLFLYLFLSFFHSKSHLLSLTYQSLNSFRGLFIVIPPLRETDRQTERERERGDKYCPHNWLHSYQLFIKTWFFKNQIYKNSIISSEKKIKINADIIKYYSFMISTAFKY